MSLKVRVVEYALDGRAPAPSQPPDEDQLYRLVTTILDPKLAPAKDLAALSLERWEIESAFDELKTHSPALGPGARFMRPCCWRFWMSGSVQAALGRIQQG